MKENGDMHPNKDKDYWTFFRATKDSNITDVEKLSRAFEHVTSNIIRHGESEIEIARAMQDEEALVKEHVKVSTLRHARTIFSDCYQFMVGVDPWEEADA